MASSPEPKGGLRYQVDETAPRSLVAGIGLQYAVLSLSSTALMPTVAFRAAGASEPTVMWAVFASLVISGAMIALHARPIGRLGSGYVLAVGPTSAAIAVTVDALEAGGPALLAILAVAASVFQFAFALRISLLRRLLTPTVSGTALMLIPVTIVPVVFGLLGDVPAGSGPTSAAACAGVTILVVGGIMLKGSASLRTWAPVGGIVAGSVVAAAYGLYDLDRVLHAPWFGLPTSWPTHFGSLAADLDIEAFAGLLPSFVLLFFICAIRSMSSALAIQTVAWRAPRAMDFRPVQGTIAADALSNLTAGLAGTMPNSANSATVARTQLTGVAARPVGLVYGAVIALSAFCPKVVALILAVPAPVFAGYVTVMIASTFTIGLRMAAADAADHRQGLIVGLAFWVGAGCQYGFIFPDFVAAFAGGLLKSALTTGGLVAILLTALLVLTAQPRKRLETQLALTALPTLRDFVRGQAARHEWPTSMADRVEGVAEEALLTLLRDTEEGAEQQRRLLVAAARDGDGAVLDFIAAGGRENIEDRLAVLGDGAADESNRIERDVSLRLLRHLADDVRHRQYQDVDVLTVRVDDR